MKLKVYSIKDTKIGFKTPFYTFNDQVAIRMMANTVKDEKNTNEINLNPEDHQLWYLGEFDDANGELTSEVKFVANAIDFKIKKGE